MTEQLVDFETAKLAREKGFDEPCMYAYINRGSPKEVNPIMGHNVFDIFENQMKLEKRHPGAMEALKRRMENHMVVNSERPPHVFGRPTQDLLERWLREVHGIWMQAEVHNNMRCYAYVSENQHHFYAYWNINTEGFDTHELAREAAIVHALKLLPDAQTKG